MGGYGPIQERVRNYDCRSRFYKLTMNLMNYCKYFDKPFIVDRLMTWFSLILQLAVTGNNFYNLVSTCSAQYENVLGGDYWY